MIQFKTESRDYYSGQQDLTLVALDGQKRIGKIDYSKYGDEISIQMINVISEMSRKGIGTLLLKKLQSEYPDIEIEWGYTTTDGDALYSATKFIDVPNKDYEIKSKRLVQLNMLSHRFENICDGFDNLPEHTRHQKILSLNVRWNRVNDAIYRLENEMRHIKPSKRLIDIK